MPLLFLGEIYEKGRRKTEKMGKKSTKEKDLGIAKDVRTCSFTLHALCLD